MLATVPDPEIPSVMLPDLGVIRGVAVRGDAVTVRMSPTYTGCPATDLMQMMIREQLTAAGFASVTVDLCAQSAMVVRRHHGGGAAEDGGCGHRPPGSPRH